MIKYGIDKTLSTIVNMMVKLYCKYIFDVLSFVESECEVVSSVLGVEGVPVEVVRIEDMDECAEGETIVPASGEVGHRDGVIFQPILNPHQDHLFCTRARPGEKLEHER